MGKSPVFPDSLSAELRDLIGSLLTKDPGGRPSIPRIYSHPWMRDIMERKLRADGTGVAKIHDGISALEMGTLEQMVGLGYDVKGLFEEVTGHTMNQRTAVYKLLRKREGAPPGEGHAICQTGTKSLAELPRFVGDWADEPAVAGSRTVRGSDERPVPGRRLGKRIAPSMSMGPGLLYEARRSTLINHAPRIMPLTFGTPDGAP